MGGLDLGGHWPEIVSSHAVGGCSCILVALLFVLAGAAIVLDANGVVAVGPTVVAHVASVVELAWFASAAAASAAAASVAAAAAAAVVLLVCDGLREQCDGVREELDLRGDAVKLCVLCLCCIRDVRCELCCLFLVGDCGASNFLDVLPDLVAHVCHLVGTFVPGFRRSAVAVLRVCFEIIDKGFEVSLRFGVVIFDEDGLVFPWTIFDLSKQFDA